MLPEAGLMRAGCWEEQAPGQEPSGAPACPAQRLAQPEHSVGLGAFQPPLPGGWWQGLYLSPAFSLWPP